MRKCILLLVLFVSISGFSQSVNDYQYVIVPTKFSIFKENNRFNLNTTTKLLLEKYGFKVYLSTDKIPNEIGDNCQRLYADLIEDKEFMATKVKIVLKDCKERIVYETEMGKSREKDFATAYNQALRETAKSFDKLNYKYSGKSSSTSRNVAEATLVEDIPLETPATTSSTIEAKKTSETFFFAQPTADGFQVVNNEPRVIMKLYTTSEKNVFLASKEGKTGLVISKNGMWFFEYLENSKKVSEPINLRF